MCHSCLSILNLSGTSNMTYPLKELMSKSHNKITLYFDKIFTWEQLQFVPSTKNNFLSLLEKKSSYQTDFV